MLAKRIIMSYQYSNCIDTDENSHKGSFKGGIYIVSCLGIDSKIAKNLLL